MWVWPVREDSLRDGSQVTEVFPENPQITWNGQQEGQWKRRNGTQEAAAGAGRGRGYGTAVRPQPPCAPRACSVAATVLMERSNAPRSAAAESTEAPESRLLRGCFASCSCTLRSRCRLPSPCAGAVPRCTTRAICACAEEPRFTRGPGQSWRLYAANVPCAPTCCVQIRVVCARCRSDDLRDVFPQRLQLIHWGR